MTRLHPVSFNWLVKLCGVGSLNLFERDDAVKVDPSKMALLCVLSENMIYVKQRMCYGCTLCT